MDKLPEMDSAGSWILLEDQDKGRDLDPDPEPDEVAEKEPERQAVEDIVLPETDSDGISVISESEDLLLEEPVPEQTVSCQKREVTKTQRKPPANGKSLTSVCFMIMGLIVAIYFHEYYDKDVAPFETEVFKPVRGRDIFPEPSMRLARDVEHVERSRGSVKYHREDYENYKKKPKKYYDIREREDFLNRKQQHLKHKEEKLKRKHLKINAKSTEVYKKLNKKESGDWYGQLHSGRDHMRKAAKSSEWMFERSQGRKQKRDKARWYFGMMDQRESTRFNKG